MAVKEGSALINLPEGVFYNPVQEFNRDLTVAVVKHYAKIHLEEFVNKGIKKAGENGRPEPASYLGLSVLEALAASGLRSVRFAKEVPLLCKIVANDLDPEATKLIAENAKLNAVEDVVVPSCADAVRLMHDSVKNKFHVVDIDPYGTASPFLDAAVQCLFDGGLLCVTCTDMAVLCGTAAGTAYGKYGGVAIKMAAQHEQGLRLLLHAIQQAASRHDKVIEPLLALSVDFYARVFVRVRTSPSGVRRIASRLAIIYSCTGCQSFYLQRMGAVMEDRGLFTPAHGPPVEGARCPQCGGTFALGGPLWADELHNRDFLNGLLNSLKRLNTSPSFPEETVTIPEWLTLAKGVRSHPLTEKIVVPGTLDRLIGMLSVATEELPDCPLYFQSDRLCATLRTVVPKIALIRSALLNAGYRVSFSHAALSSIKTDAPMSFIWDVMCAWKRKHEAEVRAQKRLGSPTPPPPREGDNVEMGDGEKTTESKKQSKCGRKHPPSEAALCVVDRLMSRPPNPAISFDPHPDANPPSRASGLLRYQINPQPNWGPKARPPRSAKNCNADDAVTSPQPKKLKALE